MLDANEKTMLQEKAKELREKLVHVTYNCGGSHLGGALSQMDILVALYYKYLNIDPKDPEKPDRDRFVLSKGHGGVGHATLLGDKGYFDPELLNEFNKTGSPFGMHLDKNKVPGVDASTGSLGHGLSIAVGLAMGARFKGENWRTYCVLGDGECHEGSIWEAAMAGAHYKLTNLTVFVDRNMLSLDGNTEDVMKLEPFADKWTSFGWRVITIDGHDYDKIGEAIEAAQVETEKPVVILAETIKGKGVSFMENDIGWHYGGLDDQTRDRALEEIRKG